MANENGLDVDIADFEHRFKEHQQKSQQGAQQRFKGGLADNSEQTTKLHTATHLLQAALRKVLGDEVMQRGSNITVERLRFDFSFGRKVTKEELAEVERLVNEAIDANAPVTSAEMSLDEAREKGAIGLFEDRYGEKVKVYTIEGFSVEVCGGPHVENTGEIGSFKIKKEESSSAGVRRIRAVIGE
jgi:alanyl-tRNA synthetase